MRYHAGQDGAGVDVAPSEDHSHGGEGDEDEGLDVGQGEEEAGEERREEDAPAAAQPAEQEAAKKPLSHKRRQREGEYAHQHGQGNTMERFIGDIAAGILSLALAPF